MTEVACLSDEELMPLVGGEPAPADVAGHLDGCPVCRGRLERVKREVTTLRSIAGGQTFLSVGGAPQSLPAAAIPSSALPEVPAAIGRYRVIGVLDRGGQATVYRVAHPNLPRELVVKLAHKTPRRNMVAADRQECPSSSDRQECPSSWRDRLVAEGKILADLDHPNLARVYDLDFYEDRPFLVMEYVRGCNLSQYAAQRRPSPREAATLLAGVARALAAAHARGLVHLDVKPANIVIDANVPETPGRARLIDFGIAQVRSAWTDETADGGVVSGTPGFASPEQVAGRPTDGRSDLFSLGATLYYLLVGRAPFDAPSTLAAVGRSERCEYDRGALRAAGAPRALRRVCQQAMQADPAMRYATAEAMAADLESYAAAPRRRRRILTAAAGAAAILAAVAVWSYFTHFSRGTPGANGDGPPPVSAQKNAEVFAQSLLGRPLRHDFWIKMDVVGSTPDPSGLTTLVEGQRVALRVEVDRDCYLGVWHIDAQGTVTQLFPNQFEPEPLVRTGQPRTIPRESRYAIRATRSEGHEYLLLVARTQPWKTGEGSGLGPYIVFQTPAEQTQWKEQLRGMGLEGTPPDGDSPGVGAKLVAEWLMPLEVRGEEP